jgi:ABC-type transport system involved in multi-copper enzyme maturation permease subunit
MTEMISENRMRRETAPPSDINQVGVVVKYEVLKYLRSKRLLGLIVIEVLVLLLLTALPPLLGTNMPQTPTRSSMVTRASLPL